MQKAPKQIFILEDGKYIEVNYEYYQRLMTENTKRKFWPFEESLMEVSEQDYQFFSKERERTRYLKKRSVEFEISYDALTTEMFNGEDSLVDEECCVEEKVEQKLLLVILQEAIKVLSEDERKLLEILYQEGKSERDAAAQEGVSQVAIHKRKQRILDKLKKYF